MVEEVLTEAEERMVEAEHIKKTGVSNRKC
jgi:hypothetical protein